MGVIGVVTAPRGYGYEPLPQFSVLVRGVPLCNEVVLGLGLHRALVVPRVRQSGRPLCSCAGQGKLSCVAAVESCNSGDYCVLYSAPERLVGGILGLA